MSKERDLDFNKFAYWVDRRRPSNHDNATILQIAKDLFPEKLQMKVLQDLMEAACTWDFLATFKFKEAKRSAKEFCFGQYRWLSTIKQHDSLYESANPGIAPKAIYNFINVILPNDGYIYSPELETRQGFLDTTEEDAQNFKKYFDTQLKGTKLFGKDPVIYANYSASDSGLKIYCVDKEKKNILTIKFHHGVPEGRALKGSIEERADGLDFKYGQW